MESIAKIILNTIVVALIVYAAFAVSPYVGWAALATILFFSLKK